MKHKYGYLINNKLVETPLQSVDFEYFEKLKELLYIKKADKYPFVRIGTQDRDGGYVMIDDFKNGNVAYSFGICDNVAWDSDMADRGYQIFMYDHTIDNLPFKRDKFHFFKKGISAIPEPEKSLNTLEYYIEQNGHKNQKNMVLKMDVEGYEWDFLDTVKNKTLEQFSQIVVEFHRMLNCKNGERTLKLLRKLNETHQLVHLHGNNCGLGIQIDESVFPDMIEATYLNKKNYELTDSEIILPTKLDAPNDPTRDDIILGRWNL